MLWKRILPCAAALILAGSLSGCGQKEAPQPTTAAATVPTTARTAPPVPASGWITADSLRVRGGPGLAYEVIGGLTAGEAVEITGRTGDWYGIRFGNTTGYVSGQYLTFTAPADG